MLLFILLYQNAAATITSNAVIGNWSNGASWVGGNVPQPTDAVVIVSGANITVDGSYTCASLTINAPTANNGLTISSPYSLTVTGAITMNSPTSGTITSTIAVGSGTLNVASITIPGSITAGRYCTVSVSTGTINVTGNIMFSGTAAQARLTFIGDALLNIGGNLGSGGTLTTSGNGTIKFNGSVAQTIGIYTTYNNIEIANTSGGVTLTGTTTFGGSLTINDGSTFTAGAYTFTVSGTTTVGGGTSGTLLISSTTGTKTFTGSVTINSGGAITESAAEQLAFGSDVTINGTLIESGAAIVGFAGSLTNNGTYIASTGTHTLSGASKTIGGTNAISIPTATFTGNYINSGTLTCGTLLTVTGAAIRLTNNGTITATTALSGTGGVTQGTTGVLYIGGTSGITTLTATAVGNTVNYYKGGAQTVKATIYDNLTLSGSGAKTTTSVTVNNILSMEGSATASALPTYGTDATLQYKGSSAQTTGPEFKTPWASSGGVKIENASGVTLGGAKDMGIFTLYVASIVSNSIFNDGGAGKGLTSAGNVQINNNGAMNCSAGFTIGSLDLNGTSTLTLSGVVDYTITGNVTSASGTTFTQSVNWGAKKLNIGGNLELMGNYNWSGVSSACIRMYGGAGTTKYIKNPNTTFSYLLLETGDYYCSGNLNVTNQFWAMYNTTGSFHTAGYTVWQTGTGVDYIQNSGGTIFVDGGSINSNVVIYNNATLTMTDGGAITTPEFDNGKLNVGIINITNATLNATQFFNGVAGGTSTVNINSSGNLSSITGVYNGNLNPGNIVVNSGGTITTPMIQNSQTIAGTGSITVSGIINATTVFYNGYVGSGALTINSGGIVTTPTFYNGTTSTSSGTLGINGTLNGAQLWNGNNGSVPCVASINDGGILNLSDVIINGFDQNGTINISNLGTVNAGGIVNGKFSGHSGTGTITCTNNSAINITGAWGWKNNGTFVQATSTVTFNSNAAQNIMGSSNSTFYNLIIDRTGAGSNALTIGDNSASGKTIEVTKTFNWNDHDDIITIGNGQTITFKLSDAIGGAIIIPNGCTLQSTSVGTIQLAGDWTNNGTFTHGNSAITLSGYATQTISGSSDTQFYNLTINRSGAGSNALILGDNATPGKTIEVTNTFDWMDNDDIITVGNGQITTFKLSHSIGGAIIIANGCILQSTSVGTIQMAGNWTNNGTFTQGTGTVIFDGTSSQSFGGISPTIFYNFITNNSAGVNLINNNLTVSNSLTLNSGMINTGTYEVNITNASPLAITGHQAVGSGLYISSTRINGNLRRSVSSSGSYDFPVSTNANYELATLNMNSTSGGMTNILAKYTTPIIPTDISSLGMTIFSTPVTDLLDYGFWTITPDAGSAVYDITITSYGHTNGGADPTTHTIVKRANSGSNWAVYEGNHNNATQSGSGSNPITAKLTNMTGFSDFAIAKNKDGYSLPVELLNFSAMCKENTANLSWSTSSETNNNFFSIEKSIDTFNWDVLAKISGAGNSNNVQNYAYEDTNPNSQITYYRLKQVDFDGAFTYSKVVALNCGDSKTFELVSIIPGQNDNEIDIIFTAIADESYTFNLIDYKGQIVKELSGKAGTSGTIEMPINISNLEAGIYLITFQSNEKYFVQKIFFK